MGIQSPSTLPTVVYASKYKGPPCKHANYSSSPSNDSTCDKILISRPCFDVIELLGKLDILAKSCSVLIFHFLYFDFPIVVIRKSGMLSIMQAIRISPSLPHSKKEGTSTAAQLEGL